MKRHLCLSYQCRLTRTLTLNFTFFPYSVIEKKNRRFISRY